MACAHGVHTGLLVYLCLGPVLGVNMAHMWGVITFLLNYIPNVGPVIATLLPTPVAEVFLKEGAHSELRLQRLREEKEHEETESANRATACLEEEQKEKKTPAKRGRQGGQPRGRLSAGRMVAVGSADTVRGVQL